MSLNVSELVLMKARWEGCLEALARRGETGERPISGGSKMKRRIAWTGSSTTGTTIAPSACGRLALADTTSAATAVTLFRTCIVAFAPTSMALRTHARGDGTLFTRQQTAALLRRG